MNNTDIVPLLGHGFMHDGGSALGGGFIVPILFGFAMAAFVFWLLRRFGPGSRRRTGASASTSSPEDAARTRLAERLANGEISPEEYLERTSALRSPSGTTESPA